MKRIDRCGIVVWCGLVCSAMGLTGTTGMAAEPWLATSFESAAVGPFAAANWRGIEWTATGDVSITDRYSHTGDRALHLSGKPDGMLTLRLPEKWSGLRGVAFVAERWTSRDPFVCRVEVEREGAWQVVADLSGALRVGKRFLSPVRLEVPEGPPIAGLRIVVVAPEGTGVLIDDLELLEAPPQRPLPVPYEAAPTKPLALLDSQVLFRSGSEQTHTFRIPAIVTATNGDLIVACDARRESAGDLNRRDPIDIVVRRSRDGGQSWTSMEAIESVDTGGCSDPSLLVDRDTGRLFCFWNYMAYDGPAEYRFMVQRSDDHGRTWSVPEDVTDALAGDLPRDAFRFVTSGRGEQTPGGRLLHTYVHVGHGVSLFGSDDAGETWRKLVDLPRGDESKVCVLDERRWIVHSRWRAGSRVVHRTADGGAHWETEPAAGLRDPRCNAAILRWQPAEDRDGGLLFCNPASNRGRRNLAVRFSDDDGRSWGAGQVIDAGPAAYAEMTQQVDATVGVVYEAARYGEIRYVRFDPRELVDR